MAPCVSLCDINVAIGARAVYYQLCSNFNNTAILNCSATNYIPHESSMSQLTAGADTGFRKGGGGVQVTVNY